MAFSTTHIHLHRDGRSSVRLGADQRRLFKRRGIHVNPQGLITSQEPPANVARERRRATIEQKKQRQLRPEHTQTT